MDNKITMTFDNEFLKKFFDGKSPDEYECQELAKKVEKCITAWDVCGVLYKYCEDELEVPKTEKDYINEHKIYEAKIILQAIVDIKTHEKFFLKRQLESCRKDAEREARIQRVILVEEINNVVDRKK